MPRIDSLGESSPYHVPEKKKAQKKGRVGAFSSLIMAHRDEAPSEDFDESEVNRTLEELLDGVFASGERLKRLPTLETVKEYKQKVKSFVKYVVTRMLGLKETTSGVNILKRKRFTLVEVIDRKMENLAVAVLSSQRDQLAILAQVDEINGLLVDLVS